MIVGYDFEVFKHDWLVVLIDADTEEVRRIHNDAQALKEAFEQYKDDVWVGYNNRSYDQYILKAIISGLNPKELNDYIIKEHKPGWSFSDLFNNIRFVNWDVMMLGKSLKQLEAYQGHNIHETDVSFDIDRPLTADEVELTFSYCENDVVEALNIFFINISDFEVQLELIKEFELPFNFVSKTQTQLTAEILQATKCDYRDDFELDLPGYLEEITKYRNVLNWYKRFIGAKVSDAKNIYQQKLECDVAGVPHTFGWGGAHGAIPKYHGTGYYLHIDVHQYYPSLVISNNFYPRSVSPEGKKRYEMMKDESVRLKAYPELKKKRNGYKLCNNKMTGGMKDKYSKLYDPRNNNNICVTGQLAILLLIEMLEPYVQLIQSNTDGIIVKLSSLDMYDKVDDVCYEWEQMTGVSLGFDEMIRTIYQKDVNNYVYVDYKGNVEKKGAYVKELNPLDNDLAVVNEALVNYMIRRTPIETTINNCEDYVKFQRICKITDNFEYAEHVRHEFRGLDKSYKYTNKCFRIFASKDRDDGAVYKRKGEQLFKFADTSEHSYIENGDITLSKVPDKLDRKWYIDLAHKRLSQFGGESIV